MKLDFSLLIFEKSSNIKFNENPSSGSRVVPWDGQTDRQTEMTKLIFAFCNFANASKDQALGRFELLVTILVITWVFVISRHVVSIYLSSGGVTCLRNLSLLSPIRVTAYALKLEPASSEFPLNAYSSIPSHIHEDLAFQTPAHLLNYFDLNVPHNTIFNSGH